MPLPINPEDVYDESRQLSDYTYAAPGMGFRLDRSRGLSGRDWIGSQRELGNLRPMGMEEEAPEPYPLPVSNAPGVRFPDSERFYGTVAPGSNLAIASEEARGEAEGRRRAIGLRELADAAKSAQSRATLHDPLGLRKTQIQAQGLIAKELAEGTARTNALSGALEIGDAYYQRAREQMLQNPKYKTAAPALQKQMEEELERRIKAILGVSMAFAAGRVPGQYAPGQEKQTFNFDSRLAEDEQ